MPQSLKLVTVFGGSGFVGRYIVRRMAKDGWRVRVAVRHPNEAIFVRSYGVVGQVEPVLANVRDDASVEAAVEGADAVVNCVSALQETGKQTFTALNLEGARRIAAASAAAGVARLVHISALGAHCAAKSRSARSKADGEAAVLAAFPSAMILRPSVIFGDEDQFFNRFADLIKMLPVVPLVGGTCLLQPVYVDNVAQAACKGVRGDAKGGIYELGGPEVASLSSLVGRLLGIIRRRRLVLNVPFFIGNFMGKGFDALQFLSFGVFTNTIVTADQVEQLRTDNVVSPQARTLSSLGISETAMDSVVEQYLYRHRPYGQYAAVTESAQNLPDTAPGVSGKQR